MIVVGRGREKKKDKLGVRHEIKKTNRKSQRLRMEEEPDDDNITC